MDRLPNESAKAYAAFAEYLRLGPQRSIERAARVVGKGTATCRKWSERHGWVRRAAEWDECLIRQERELAGVLTRERAAEWVKRQERLREAEWAAAEEAVALCRELMGRMELKATLGDVAKLLDVASKLGRLATGLETDRRELAAGDVTAVKVEIDVGAMVRRIYCSDPAVQARLEGPQAAIQAEPADGPREEGQEGEVKGLKGGDVIEVGAVESSTAA